MVVNKRKKNSRARGTWTHGWGEKKKHRHAGSRGGRGNAGTGKRADQKKPSIAADPQYFGKFGFVVPGGKPADITVNASDIQSNILSFVEAGYAKKDGAGYVIDLTKSRYTKLLGGGQITMQLTITVASAAAGAIAKVEAAKGKVTTTVAKKVKKVKKVAEATK